MITISQIVFSVFCFLNGKCVYLKHKDHQNPSEYLFFESSTAAGKWLGYSNHSMVRRVRNRGKLIGKKGSSEPVWEVITRPNPYKTKNSKKLHDLLSRFLFENIKRQFASRDATTLLGLS